VGFRGFRGFRVLFNGFKRAVFEVHSAGVVRSVKPTNLRTS
jgi:hypothetical protein